MLLKGHSKYILEGAWIRLMGSVVLSLLQYVREGCVMKLPCSKISTNRRRFFSREHAGAGRSAVEWQMFKVNLGSQSRSGKRNLPRIAKHIETFPAYEDLELQNGWRLEECLWEAGCLHALVLCFSHGICFG